VFRSQLLGDPDADARAEVETPDASFVRTRAGTRVRHAQRAATATCTHAITRGRAVLVHVFADHVVDSTRVEAGG
jgi:DNA integrity scanning protein DisA with diadenylate cyclase activity